MYESVSTSALIPTGRAMLRAGAVRTDSLLSQLSRKTTCLSRTASISTLMFGSSDGKSSHTTPALRVKWSGSLLGSTWSEQIVVGCAIRGPWRPRMFHSRSVATDCPSHTDHASACITVTAEGREVGCFGRRGQAEQRRRQRRRKHGERGEGG